jgi:hypothetical protein
MHKSAQPLQTVDVKQAGDGNAGRFLSDLADFLTRSTGFHDRTAIGLTSYDVKGGVPASPLTKARNSSLRTEPV